MNIDNEDAYHRIRGILALATIFFSTLIAFSAFYEIIPTNIFSAGRLVCPLVFGGLFILFLIYRAKLKYHYVFYNDESNKIILRYYPFSSFNAKHISIEIPFDKLYKIEIKKAFLNLQG